MLLAFGGIVAGLILLVWSADKFIDGSATTARYAGLPPLIIGMVIVGFGTSAPEMIVSAIAAGDGNPDLALGNAFGSNIVNITLILGVTALISPILVQSSTIRKELPFLLIVVVGCGLLIFDGAISTIDSVLLLLGFLAFFIWTIVSGLTSSQDPLIKEFEQEVSSTQIPLKIAIFWLITGLILLLISSRVLVWGAVEIATILGVSDLMIGLTVVALGTSLPELAASVIAAKKGEHDIAIGNIVGSNIFNILAVVGIAGLIEPISTITPEVIYRDWSVMLFTTLILLIMSFGFGRQGRINRFEGALLSITYVGYNGYLAWSSL